ncbi:inositol monophosphatase family protein [Phenylobacterium sp.]|uniref:inositol monophosphatase family protein n=1 Tax=Phenylobacterium sp. TaxID=1871053 RepID=UPI002FC6DFDB
MSSPSDLVSTMIAAAKAAGDRLRLDFAEIASLEVHLKQGHGDPFSIADLRAEETVRAMLAAAYPAYGFLGEEGGLVEGEDKANTWVVDPLDGTMNFLIGLPIFAVNIALAREGQVVAGVTYQPMTGEMFWAEKGKGAFLNGEPIRVSKRASLGEAVIAVGIPFAGKPRHAQFAHEMSLLTPRVAQVRRLGAGAIDTAYVACGRFDAYWEQSVSAWDMAAGAILVTEAGGLITDTLGRPLDLMNGTCLASTPQIQADLLAILQPIDTGAAA